LLEHPSAATSAGSTHVDRMHASREETERSMVHRPLPQAGGASGLIFIGRALGAR
jgi:hypothetical protein